MSTSRVEEITLVIEAVRENGVGLPLTRFHELLRDGAADWLAGLYEIGRNDTSQLGPKAVRALLAAIGGSTPALFATAERNSRTMPAKKFIAGGIRYDRFYQDSLGHEITEALVQQVVTVELQACLPWSWNMAWLNASDVMPPWYHATNGPGLTTLARIVRQSFQFSSNFEQWFWYICGGTRTLLRNAAQTQCEWLLDQAEARALNSEWIAMLSTEIVIALLDRRHVLQYVGLVFQWLGGEEWDAITAPLRSASSPPVAAEPEVEIDPDSGDVEVVEIDDPTGA